MTTRAILASVSLLAASPFLLCSCGQAPTTASSAGKPAGWKGATMKLPKAGDPPPPAPTGAQGTP